MAASERPQNLEALKLANEVRLARVALKRDIHTRNVLAAEVLCSELPDYLRQMRAAELARAIPHLRMGVFAAAMHHANAWVGLDLGAMTERQRLLVADHLADWECRALDRAARRTAAALAQEVERERYSSPSSLHPSHNERNSNA